MPKSRLARIGAMLACTWVFAAAAQPSAAADAAECSAALAWSADQEQAVQQLRRLYQGEEFARLDAAMECLMRDTRRFSSGKPGSAAVYWALRRQMPAPGADVREAKRIEQWRAQRPKSAFAELAGYRLQYANAWAARGTSTADRVGADGWDAFEHGLADTEAAMSKASRSLRDTPVWHNLLLAVVQDIPAGRARADAVFDEGVRRWPDYYDFHELRLTRLVPRWGGSWEEVDAFIGRWSTQRQAQDGNSLYARLYLSVIASGTDPRQTRLAWPRMKASLDELVERHPDPAHKNLAASLGCVYGDAAYYRSALQRIAPDESRPAAWVRGTSPAACGA